MPFEYTPHGSYDNPFNPGFCKASIPHAGRRAGFHQCGHRAKKDGWCTRHHPDTVARKKAEQEEEWRREDEYLKRQANEYKKAQRRHAAERAFCAGISTEALEHAGEGAMKRLAGVLKWVIEQEISTERHGCWSCRYCGAFGTAESVEAPHETNCIAGVVQAALAPFEEAE